MISNVLSRKPIDDPINSARDEASHPTPQRAANDAKAWTTVRKHP